MKACIRYNTIWPFRLYIEPKGVKINYIACTLGFYKDACLLLCGFFA